MAKQVHRYKLAAEAVHEYQEALLINRRAFFNPGNPYTAPIRDTYPKTCA